MESSIVPSLFPTRGLYSTSRTTQLPLWNWIRRFRFSYRLSQWASCQPSYRCLFDWSSKPSRYSWAAYFPCMIFVEVRPSRLAVNRLRFKGSFGTSPWNLGSHISPYLTEPQKSTFVSWWITWEEKGLQSNPARYCQHTSHACQHLPTSKGNHKGKSPGSEKGYRKWLAEEQAKVNDKSAVTRCLWRTPRTSCMLSPTLSSTTSLRSTSAITNAPKAFYRVVQSQLVASLHTDPIDPSIKQL